jgi:hypothetical protein
VPGADMPQTAFSPGRASPISGGGEVTAAACPKSARGEVAEVNALPFDDLRNSDVSGEVKCGSGR